MFVPASRPPHKSGVTRTPYEHRYRMVELACQGEPLFEASRLEQDEQNSYSIETIERVRASLDAGDELFFLIGADAFAEIRTWHRWRDVIASVDFIVVSRPGRRTRCPKARGCIVSRESTCRYRRRKSGARLAAGDDRVDVPPAVLAYIREHGLYR